MRKITSIPILLLIALANVHAQGLETFDNAVLTASYTDGYFIGNDDITWNFIHARNEGDFPIDGKGIILRRSDEPSSLKASLTGGIGDFSVDTRKAFTGNSQRRLDLLINDIVVATFEPSFANGEDNTVIPFEVTNIDVQGDFTLELRVSGASGARQITLDNLSWTPSTLAIQERDIQGFNMHPNPTNTGRVIIQTNNNKEKLVKVYDVLGKQVISQRMFGNTLDVSGLKAGVYLVQVTQNSSSATKKLIIN